MKTKTNFVVGSYVFLSLLFIQGARAQPAVSSAPPNYTCMSWSKSLPFTAQGPIQLLVQDAAIRACEADIHTTNGECSTQVTCKLGQPAGLLGTVSCKTISHDIPFDLVGDDELTTKAAVIRACQASASTGNDECLTGAVCDVKPVAGPGITYSCLSESKSLLFASTGADYFGTQDKAIRACQSAPGTGNDECAKQVQCESVNANSTAKWACSASALSIPFNSTGTDHFQTMVDAVSKCEASLSAGNVDCRSSVKCQTY